MLGFEPCVVLDGEQVVAVARECRPDLILLDIALPGSDGYRVARALRKEGFETTIIVAVSGYGSEEDRRRSLESGMDYHLTKPLDVRTIASLLGTSRGARRPDSTG